MELEQNVNFNLINTKGQNEFLNSTLWKAINNGINIGLRYILPDLVEDEVINLKDNLLEYGLKEGIKKSINSTIEVGKQTVGVFSGNFENIDQIEKVIKNGEVIGRISNVIDGVIERVERNGKINKSTSKILKKGKTSILSNIEKNIENTLNKQVNTAKNIEKYMNNWYEFYKLRDWSGMQKEYSKLEEGLKELIPLENILKNARYIENIHKLIENKGEDFELTDIERELAEKLAI